MFEAIVAGNVTEEIQAMAAAEIEKLNAANARRREQVSKKAQENAPLIEKIVNEILGEEPLTATMVGEKLGVSTQKASALCRQAVKDGQADVQDRARERRKATLLASF